MKEVWKDIKGFEGWYQVSNKGRVRSIERQVIIGKGVFKSCHSHQLTHYTNRYGYNAVTLANNGKNKLFRIHRLVCEAFIKNHENKPFVNHKNGIKTDNRVENLEWVTAKENTHHAIKNGLVRVAKGESLSNLTGSQVLEIRASDENPRSICKKYGVSFTAIYDIRARRTWAHL